MKRNDGRIPFEGRSNVTPLRPDRLHVAELAAHEELASLEQLVDQFGVCAETGPALADGLESLGRRFDKLTAEEQARFDVLFERVGARLRSNIDAQAIDLHHGEFK